MSPNLLSVPPPPIYGSFLLPTSNEDACHVLSAIHCGVLLQDLLLQMCKIPYCWCLCYCLRTFSLVLQLGNYKTCRPAGGSPIETMLIYYQTSKLCIFISIDSWFLSLFSRFIFLFSGIIIHYYQNLFWCPSLASESPKLVFVTFPHTSIFFECFLTF